MATRTIAGKRRFFYGVTDDEAELKADAASGQLKATNTTGSFILANYVPLKMHRSSATKDQTAYVLDRFIYPALGKKDPATLELGDFQAVINEMIRNKYSPHTVQTVFKHLKQIGKLMARARLIPWNFAEDCSVPAARKSTAHYSLEQLQALMFYSFSGSMYPLEVLMAACGLRLGEALAVQTHKIGSKLIIDRQRNKFEETDILKTDNAYRQIALPESLEDHLKDIAHGRYIVQEYVQSSVHKPMHRDMEAAGLTRIKPEALRDSCAAGLGALGCPLHVRARILGHSQRNITDEYTHVSDDEIRRWLGLWWDALSTPGDYIACSQEQLKKTAKTG